MKRIKHLQRRGRRGYCAHPEGANLAKCIEWLLPYTAVSGVILLVATVAQEITRNCR